MNISTVVQPSLKAKGKLNWVILCSLCELVITGEFEPLSVCGLVNSTKQHRSHDNRLDDLVFNYFNWSNFQDVPGKAETLTR